MSSLVERATEDPGSVSGNDLEALVMAAVSDIDATAIRALVAVADAEPDHVDRIVESLGRLVDGERTELELEMALKTAAALGRQHPDRVAALAPVALGYVGDHNPSVADAAVEALAGILPAVDDIEGQADTVADLLAGDGLRQRAVGVELAGVLAEERPAAAVALLDGLLGVVGTEYGSEVEVLDARDIVEAGGSAFEETVRQEDETRGVNERVRERAARAVGRVAERRPNAVAGRVDRIAALLREESVPPVRYALVDALAPVAEHDPGTAMAALEPLADCLGAADRPADTARTARTVGLLAERDEQRVAEAVRPHLDAVLDALADDAPARGVAASLLAYVAEQYPAAAAAGTDDLLMLLDADDPSVRASAALALGAVGGEEVRDRLAAVASADPDERARTAAARALDRVDEQ